MTLLLYFRWFVDTLGTLVAFIARVGSTVSARVVSMMSPPWLPLSGGGRWYGPGPGGGLGLIGCEFAFG